MILICNDFQHRDFPAVCLKKSLKEMFCARQGSADGQGSVFVMDLFCLPFLNPCS